MFPLLFDFSLSPHAFTVVLYLGAVILPALFAWRAWKDVKDGLDDDPSRPWKVGLGWGAMLLALVTLGVKPWTRTSAVDVPLHTYGLLIAMGFVSAIIVTTREAERTGLDKNHILDLAFWVLLSGLGGARIVFILVNLPQYFGANFFTPDLVIPLVHWRVPTILAVWRGGLVFYGGLLGAFLAVVIYLKKFKLPFFRYTDAIVPAVALGHFFGRLGCFSAGCCFGKPVSPGNFFATYFPQGSLAFMQTKAATHIEHLGQLTTGPIYPTQLFESLAVLMIFFILIAMRRRKRFHGQLLITYFILYPIWRSFNECLRGDYLRGMIFRWPAKSPLILSTSQLISIFVVGMGVAFMVYRLRRIRAEARDQAGAGKHSGVAAA